VLDGARHELGLGGEVVELAPRDTPARRAISGVLVRA
jgi:hypothetical protein